jgi:beta-glucanase (GH16 family)
MRAPDRGPDALATLVKRLLPAAAAAPVIAALTTALVIAALTSPAADKGHGRSSIGVRWTTTTVPSVAGRKLVFEDDFNGTTLNTAGWSPYKSAGNAGNGLRRPSAFSLDGDGHLVITARMINGRIVSGGMSNRLNQTYGLFEFRVRTDPDPTGTMSGVVLTWPQSGRWPKDGEEDIYETGDAVNTRWPFSSFVHYTSRNRQYSFHHHADGAQWHTMAMDWTADAIKIYRDGVLVWTIHDKAAIPDVAHHLCIQLDAKATRTLTTPVRMYIDDVRIYR